MQRRFLDHRHDGIVANPGPHVWDRGDRFDGPYGVHGRRAREADDYSPHLDPVAPLLRRHRGEPQPDGGLPKGAGHDARTDREPLPSVHGGHDPGGTGKHPPPTSGHLAVPGGGTPVWDRGHRSTDKYPVDETSGRRLPAGRSLEAGEE